MIKACMAALAAVVLAACSSAGSQAPPSVPYAETAVVPSADRAPAAITRTVALPPGHTVDTTRQTCDRVHRYLLFMVVPTFTAWQPKTDEFDPQIGRLMQAEATRLAALSGPATPAVRLAITSVVLALTQVGIAIELRSDARVQRASRQARAALAQLRNACNF